MNAKYLYMLFFTGYATLSSAQDLHFSQFNASPLNINPALTGLFNSDYRLIANHRNQWSTVTTPFVTYSASVDMNIHPYRYSKDFIGLGMLMNADRAGDADFTTLQMSPSISYTRAMANQRMFLTYGMQVGIIQRHFNPNALFFDKQYNGDAFDPGLSSGENFANSTATTFDASTGINAFIEPSDKLNFNTGISVYHFNRPTFVFTNGAISQMTPRFTIHTSGTIRLSNGVQLLPGYMILIQSGNSEYTLGSYVKLSTNNRKSRQQQLMNIYGGMWFRVRDYDAVILTTRLDYDHLSMGLSYDFNVSKLAVASNAMGGLELSVIYVFKKFTPSKAKNKRIPCPVFF